jgi:hypothetical protein
VTEGFWGQRRPPESADEPTVLGRWSPTDVAELTRARRGLAAALQRQATSGNAEEGAVERLLLVFEEIGSNALRHGREPVEVVVTARGSYWLLEVSDAASQAPPSPAVDRDAALGGLGLYLVAQICGAHGWFADGGRKTAWARIDSTRAEAPPEATGAHPKPSLEATYRGQHLD